ncbi:MAG: putative zinc-binding metallopeptidase, partial [Candidatus Omnitrophica bacterium]|nr:putative zinc-binding metallopeptidase [Candidatus Omnitrophota bacterium]
MKNKKIDLNCLSEEELLNTRICDLSIKIQGTWLESCIQELYSEIDEKGLNFRPICYLADEWLTPDGEPVVGIPFFLAHPALIKLEKKMMLEVEGSTHSWCMMLLRHEAGHALNYAYKLYRRKKWQNLFGKMSKEYADTYRFRPYSKNFVRHLEDYYAQYHPDEDFAETFAVWLNNKLDWREKYKGWKAINKLNYVDTLMDEIKTKDPIVKNGEKYWVASDIK